MSAEEQPADSRKAQLQVSDAPTQPIAARRRPSLALRSPRILISACALLALVITSTTLGYTQIYQPHMLRVQRTATAVALVTRTANAEGTSTAHIHATVTAQALATTTVLTRHQQDYELITKKPPTLNDTLRQPNLNNWDTGAGCAFVKQTYSATVNQKGYFIPCFARHTRFHNFAYEVRMRLYKGDGGGIAFRANAGLTQAYMFIIRRDGSYSFYYYPGDAKKTALTLADGSSDLIMTEGNQENTLAVISRDNRFDFYINHTYITSAQDSHLSNGQIGVIAHDVKNATEMRYVQARVWQLT